MPGGFPSTDDPESPAIPTINGRELIPPRRPSFNFLRRGKSVERMSSTRSISGAKLSKKQTKERSMSSEPEVPAIPQQPPEIPKMVTPPRLQTFGGDGARSDSLSPSYKNGGYQSGASIARRFMEARGHNTYHDVPIPPIPDSDSKPKAAYDDPFGRPESMTNRGRYSYASSAISTINSPRRVRRRKDPTPFKYVHYIRKGPHADLSLVFLLSERATLAKLHSSNSFVHLLLCQRVSSSLHCETITITTRHLSPPAYILILSHNTSRPRLKVNVLV